MFVKINGKVWDYKDYKRKVVLVKNYSRHALKEALQPYGFHQQEERFYNEELDLEIELKFSMRNKLEVV